MFGIVTATLSSISPDEKARYQAVYCGLCQALQNRYGNIARAVLSYDLTFYIVLCNALHEPPEETGETSCIVHPLKPQAYARSTWTDRAADLAVALAYHKCLDDVHDDGTVRSLTAERLLHSAYGKARERIGKDCAAIENAMACIRAIEEQRLDEGGTNGGAHGASDKVGTENVNRTNETNCTNDTSHTNNASSIDSGAANLTPYTTSAPAPEANCFDPDAASIAFGKLLGLLFAEGQGVWAESMLAFGAQLGRFIYMMDAAVDYAEDAKSGSYNPFVALGSSPADMQTALAVMAHDMSAAFEKLPLEQDINLLRSILYAGVWQKFNQTYQDADLLLAPIE